MCVDVNKSNIFFVSHFVCSFQKFSVEKKTFIVQSMSDQSSAISGVSEWIKRCKQFSKEYETLCDLTEKTLDKLLSGDDLLNDTPYDVTQEEILSKVISFR